MKKAPSPQASRAKAPASKGKKKVEFSLCAEPGAAIAVAGSFNDWQSLDLSPKKTDATTWSRTVFLPPGRYEYKFIINGQWHPDPKCAQSVPNSHGTTNSVLTVA